MAEPVSAFFFAIYFIFLMLFPWLLMFLGLGFVIYIYFKSRKKENKLEEKLKEKDSKNY